MSEDRTAEPPVGSQTDPAAPAREEEPQPAPEPEGESFGEAADRQIGEDDDG